MACLQIPCAIEQGILCMDQKSSVNLIGKIDTLPDANFYNTGHALRISFDTDWRVTAPGKLNWSPNQIDEGLSPGGV
jgi:hypothetical protein